MSNELMLIEGGEQALRAEAGGLLEKARTFESLGLISAKTEDGVHYSRNCANGCAVIAKPGMLLKKTCDTLTITLPLPGATPDGVLADIAEYTQEQKGALLGYSQSWVSQREAD